MAKATNTKPKRKPQTRRAPRDWAQKFLKHFAQTGAINYSAVQAGTKRETVWHRRQKDAAFATAYEEAAQSYAELLEEEADRRAIQGNERVVYYKGAKVGSYREFSDTLLIFRLKGLKPETYRENYKLEHSGPQGGPIEIVSIEAVKPPEANEAAD